MNEMSAVIREISMERRRSTNGFYLRMTSAFVAEEAVILLLLLNEY